MGTTFAAKDYPAEQYLQHRPHYPKQLYDSVFAFHLRDGLGKTGVALDLGCGPGLVTAELVPRFDKVVGIDGSEVMIETARLVCPQAEFHVGMADKLTPIGSASIDLLTVGTAAHWFPADWWKEASRVVKPGGTVALWVYSERMVLEPSHPKAKELNENIMSFVKGIGHYSDGNKVAKDMYESLPMPASDLGFGPVTKIWWNRDGLVDDSEDGGKGDLVMKHTLTLQTLRQRMHTYSPIHRWRTANPTKRDTSEDPVEQTLSTIKEIAGWNDSSQFICGQPLTLVMLKKK
eukprot:GHVR01154162.1.p1 GENE.GHVR01154162.1~~GHVR01154162.1.p1  ORF type:complete len:290 (+),score=21.58 GHVR01154162.1:91-960(+)